MKRFLVLPSIVLGLALNILMSSNALAQCNVFTPSSAVGPIEIDTSGPPGMTILWQRDIVLTNSTGGVGCSGIASTSAIAMTGAPVFYAGSTVYRSSIPGLGFSAEILNSILSSCYGFLTLNCAGTGQLLPPPASINLRIRLYKYDNITSVGNLSGIFANVYHTIGQPTMRLSWGSGVTVTPRRPSCSIAPGDNTVNVSLGSVSAGAFGGVGSTAGNQAFNLRVTCTGGDTGGLARTIRVRATDATTPGNTSQVLSLTAASAARGVGVQILRGTTLLTYGAASGAATDANQWTAGTVAPGVSSFTIPLSARYVRTATAMNAGTANARATFTMTFE